MNDCCVRIVPAVVTLLCAAALMAGTPGSSSAQVGGTTGTLRGNVTDSTGGATPGAGGYVDGVCDPSAGFSYTRNTIDNFGKINLKRGHRVIELVLKYYF